MPRSHDNSPKKELATNQNVAQNARTIGITTLSSDPLKIGVEDSRLFPTLTRTYFRHAMPPLQLPTIKIHLNPTLLVFYGHFLISTYSHFPIR